MNAPAADARLILSEPELDAAVETLMLAEATLWEAADAALDAKPVERGVRLGRSHFRCAFLLRRRPGLGVQALAELTGVTKQSLSRTAKDLIAAGLAEVDEGEDARRRRLVLTPAGLAFEARAATKMRNALSRAYRDAGVEAAGGARRVWSALAGARGVAPRLRGPAS